MVEKYTTRAALVLKAARDLAILGSHPEITDLHLHSALLEQEQSVISELLIHFKLDKHAYAGKVESALARLPHKPGAENLFYSRNYQKLLLVAEEIARKDHAFAVGLSHLYLALFRLDKSTSQYLLKEHGLTEGEVEKFFASQREENLVNEKYPEGIGKVLKQYGRNLNEEVELGNIDEVIGMEKELERVSQILCRRIKNNPVIIGEPGVGKTAVVEALAQRIVRGEVTEALKHKTIFALDTGSLIAGANMRGEFEQRVQEVLDILTHAKGRIILFIDEMHTVVGGNAGGGHDLANFLKPALSRGEIVAIGATTLAEYSRYIERDKALERRFQKVMVQEPSVEETIRILQGIKERYEIYHQVEISDEAIHACAELSQRYISDRFMPDKAIDLMDEVCAMLRSQRCAVEGEERKYLVTEDDVREVVYQMTSIPIQKLAEDEKERLLSLEDNLNARVIGQAKAIRKVSNALRRAHAGLKTEDKPVGAFLFYGPSGVGKTYLAKVLAQEVYAGAQNLIRLDMSEYTEKHSVSKFIGAPPGYVGYEEGGQLTEAVRRHPYSILLLDEIEKAHPEILLLLLQILDEGRLSDNKGRVIDFTNVIIILTSNLASDAELQNQEEERLRQIREVFPPEFLNRLDELLYFEPLDEESMQKILVLLIQGIEQDLRSIDIRLKLSLDLSQHLLEAANYQRYGARALERLVRDKIESYLAQEIIAGRAEKGAQLSLGLEVLD